LADKEAAMKLFFILLATLFIKSVGLSRMNTMRQSIGLEPLTELEVEDARRKSGAWREDLKKVQKRYGD
jgi:hypothetical protein